MEWLTDPQTWLSLVTLSALEIVLGIDNLIFLAILTNRLPDSDKPRAERMGLGFALASRLALLGAVFWVAGMSDPVFTIFGFPTSWRAIILAGGGLFLLAKATHEIHGALEGEDEDNPGAEPPKIGRMWPVVAEMVVLDVAFSLDSVVTAVGMANQFWVMVAAVVVAMTLMLASAEPLSAFLARHPTVKMLALAFLLMIGMALLAESLGIRIPKGYLYFAMGFAVAVEALNLLVRRARKPVRLRHPLP